MKPSASFIFDAKKIWNQYQPVSFQFHVKLIQNKNKNKDGFYWNLIFYIKQANKSRVGTFFQNALAAFNWTKPTYLKGWETIRTNGFGEGIG